MAPSSKNGGAATAAPTLAELAKQIRTLMERRDRSELAHAIEEGALLIEAKKQVPRGQWESWVRTNLGMPRVRCARNMRFATNVQLLAHCKTVPEADVLLRKPNKTTKPTSPKTTKPKPPPAGKRMHAAKMNRAEAKRNGRDLAFWEIGWEASRLVYWLAAWHVEDIPLDYDNMNAMTTVEEDLLYLYDWMDDTLSLIHGRMGEHGMRQQLRKLQARTVENGCTPAEAEAAQRAADRLRKKIDNQLEVLASTSA